MVTDLVPNKIASATMEEIRNAIVAVKLDAFIESLPQGYETPISRVQLSGGQRSRIGLGMIEMSGSVLSFH